MQQDNREAEDAAIPTLVYLLVDSAMIRAGLERVLSTEGVQVAGDASEPERALRELRELPVDVLLVDLRKPDSDGFGWGIKLRQQLPSTPVLVVREHPAPDQVELALRSGVDCVLAPDEDVSELFIALDALRRGKTYLSPRLLPNQVVREMQLPAEFERHSVKLESLEIEVVRWLALGQTVAELAINCSVPESTAVELIASVSAKLECHSAADFARFAIRQGFLPRDE